MPDAGDAASARGEASDLGRGLAWALYLGASWTWVIGMFLPVLLIRDFGPAAWFVFAIPNVVGAAAMGWAIRSPDHGARLVANHRAAAAAFSLVTIAFHLFFLVWMVPKLVGPLAGSLAFGGALVAMTGVFVMSQRSATLAAVPLAASLLVAAMLASRGSLGWPDVAARGSGTDLLALAAVCAMGFLTCPYLDLTFHRARAHCRTPRESKVAFGVGFGIVFCSMIVLTLLYAGGFLPGRFDRTFAALVGAHIAVQATYTVGIHARAVAGLARSNVMLWGVAIAAAAIGFGALGLEREGVRVGLYAIGEVCYRVFMSFYGLIAPAYVWLCVHPGRGYVAPRRREVRVCLGAIVLAAPFFWIGFVHGPMTWAVAGVAIVVLARVPVGWSRRDLLEEQRSEMAASVSS